MHGSLVKASIWGLHHNRITNVNSSFGDFLIDFWIFFEGARTCPRSHLQKLLQALSILFA
jgi:hypothetical protein